MHEREFSIRHASKNAGTVCQHGMVIGVVPGCQASLIDGREWGIFINHQRLVCRAHGLELAPPLQELADHLNSLAPPAPSEREYGISVAERVFNTTCPSCGSPVEPRKPFDVGIVGEGRTIIRCQFCREEAAPTLSGILHGLYGTAPTQRPAPEPPPVVTPEQHAVQIRNSAPARLASILFSPRSAGRPAEDVAVAAAILAIIEEYADARRLIDVDVKTEP